MKFIRGGLGKGGLRFLSTKLLQQRRSHGRGDWLRLLLLTNMLLCFGLVVLYVLRNRLVG
jgi:hypothetical protein